MRKNRKLVGVVRQTIGDKVELMVDCCRAFDAHYAVRMLRMIEEFDLTWVEEPVLPHDHEGYVKVRASSNMPIAGGEHEFSRHAFRHWAQAGGLTEAQKIVHLAAACEIQVIPHGGQMHNHHLIMANTNMPIVEHFPFEDPTTDENGIYWGVVQGEPRAQKGHITLSNQPGLVIEVDKTELQRFAWQS